MNTKKLNKRNNSGKKNSYFRVNVPLEYKSGQSFQAKKPDGSFVFVRVPENVKGGDSFVLELGDVGDDHSRGDTSSIKYDGRTKSEAYKVLKKLEKEQGFRSNTKGGTFLSQFFWGDLVVALWVGALVGASIVAGFFTGILLVTDP